jgi:hypothetical protein
MARPTKDNADYFSHDADMRNDVKVKALRRKFGIEGYAVWAMLLEHLTDCDYFEYEYSDLNIELLSGDFDVDPIRLKEIIDYLILLNLLAKEGKVIFSTNHRKRFEILLSRRKRERLGVIGEDNPTETPKSGVIGEDNPTTKGVIVADNPQSKVKESKVKESILLQDNKFIADIKRMCPDIESHIKNKKVLTSFYAYLGVRRVNRLSLSAYIIVKLISKLKTLSGGNSKHAISILDNASIGGWKDLYELDKK